MSEGRRLVVADLFCGAGGLSQGFRTASGPSGSSFDVVYGIDIDRDCMATYRANILGELPSPDQEVQGACRTARGLSGREIAGAAGVSDIDVLVGGPNCQAVSAAGLRNPDDSRNDMFGEFVRLVEELRPRWFLMENVPGLTHRNNLALLRGMLDRLAKVPGYEVAGEVLLAADYGVPQFRYRLFLVGNRVAAPIWFPPARFFARSEPSYIAIREAIGDLTERPPGAEPLPNHVIRRPDQMNVHRIRHVPQGGDWRDIPLKHLPPRNFATRSSDQKGTYGRLSWDDPAYTITSLAGNVTAGRFTHPILDRALTAREAARIQGFPDAFVFEGAPETWYRQVGNAVPPPLARALAEYILAADAGVPVPGLGGRLTPEAVRRAEDEGKSLPTMTPRLSGATAPPKRIAVTEAALPLAYDVVAATRRLEKESELPAFMWTAKRARAVLGLRAGRDYPSMARELNVSEATVRRWVDRYATGGPEGWRAYHTSLSALSGGDAATLERLREAVEEVRQPDLDQEGQQARPHMNAVVRHLLTRYGNLSVTELKRIVRDAGVDVGTVYVADLLAIADVLLGTAADSGAEAAV